jgi:hypothetical protein
LASESCDCQSFERPHCRLQSVVPIINCISPSAPPCSGRLPRTTWSSKAIAQYNICPPRWLSFGFGKSYLLSNERNRLQKPSIQGSVSAGSHYCVLNRILDYPYGGRNVQDWVGGCAAAISRSRKSWKNLFLGYWWWNRSRRCFH